MVLPASNTAAAHTVASLTLQLDHLGGRAVTLAFAILQEANFNFLMTDAVFGRRVEMEAFARFTLALQHLLCGERDDDSDTDATEFAKQQWVDLRDTMVPSDMVTPCSSHATSHIPTRRNTRTPNMR